MRVLAACSAVFLGWSAVLGLGACSDVSDGSAGSGGASGSGPTGSAGRAAAGAPSASAGATGEGTCKFISSACTGCLQSKCSMQTLDCAGDTACGEQISKLSSCACGGTMTPDQCQAAFQTAGGSLAEKLGNCYTLNCEDVCQ